MAGDRSGQFGQAQADVNMSQGERVGSMIGGAMLVMWGLKRRSDLGALAAILGGGLIYTGVTGHCAAYESMGINEADGQKAEPARESRRAEAHQTA